MSYIFTILISILCVLPAFAQETLAIENILSSDRVQLSNGQTVVLGGIIADGSAQEYLSNSFKGKEVLPVSEDTLKNRYGEVVTHLKTADGVWLQRDLIKNGLAHAYTMPSFRMRQDELLAAEVIKNVLDANAPIEKSVKGFQIVEGVVVDAVERGQYVYLNFGDDYKTDFTISTKKASHKNFLAEGFNILELKGKKIRMRGWMDHYNGPFIKLTYPEQIQIL